MKKFITLIAAAALLLALVSVPASASAGSASFTLSGPASARPGDTITVTLGVSGQYNAHTLDLRVFFDNTSFRFKSQTNSAALDQAGGFVVCEVNKDGNAVSLGVLMVMNPLTVQGELIRMEFEVLSTASPRPAFTVGIQKFSYLPVGAAVETPIPYTANDLVVSISGGSGSGTTNPPSMTPTPVQTPKPKTPKPTVQPKTPPPLGSPKPVNTQGPGDGRVTDNPGNPGGIGTPDKDTPDPNEKTPQPGQVVSTPLPTKSPSGSVVEPIGGTEQPSDSEPAGTELPAGDETQAPDETGSGEASSAAPAESTPESGEPSAPAENDGSALKTGIIIGASALAAGLAALCIVLGVRAKKKNSDKE